MGLYLIRIDHCADCFTQVRGMTVLSAIKHKRISAAMLSVVVFAWLSVIATPCAMTAVSEVLGRVELSCLDFADSCPGVNPAQSIANSDCCCLLTALVRVDAPKLPKVAMLIVVPAHLAVIDPAIVSVPKLEPGRLSADKSFPPVYLATQRLRI